LGATGDVDRRPEPSCIAKDAALHDLSPLTCRLYHHDLTRQPSTVDEPLEGRRVASSLTFMAIAGE